MLVILQCGNCANNPKRTIPESDEDISHYVCDEFPKGIPVYVEEGTADCPKFEERPL